MNNLLAANNLKGKALHIAQVAWVILVTLAIAKFTLSMVVYHQASGEICTGTMQDCHNRQQVTLQDVEGLRKSGISLEQWTIYNILYRVFSALVFCAVGFLIFIRKRDDPVALFMALFLVLFGTIGGFQGYLASRFPEYQLWFSLIEYPAYVGIAFFFFAFPNGRVVPRLAWIFIIFWSLNFLIEIPFPNINRNSFFNQVLAAIGWLGLFIGGFISQVYRYLRVSNEVERRQTKWVVFGFGLIAVLVSSSLVVPSLNKWMFNTAPYTAQYMYINTFSNLSLTLIPITVGFAVLRYRLYDIDMIIRKTLVYGALTTILALVFFGGVTLLQGVVGRLSGTENSPVAIVLSTLAIATLFSPLRRRIQDFIDQRFYRQKYNAEQALAEFADTARSETDLQALTGKLVEVVSKTVQPERVSVWLKLHGRQK
jgi:hypothetical protein